MLLGKDRNGFVYGLADDGFYRGKLRSDDELESVFEELNNAESVAKLLVDSTHVPWKNIKTVIATQSMPFEIDIWDRSSNFGYTILPNSLESRNELLDAFKEHFGKRLTVQKKRESLWKAGWPIFMTVFYVFLTIVGVFMVFEGGNHGVARGRGAGLANAIAAIADNLGIPGVLAIGGLFVAIGIGHSIWKASKRKYLIELRPRW